MKKSLLKPQARFKRITDITTDFLEEHNIKAIILDVDNTLIDLNKNPLKWIEYIKGADIKICLASNSLKKQKIESLATKLDIPYIYFSTKPLKRGLKKAIDIVDEKPQKIAEIGDQLFTDVLGSNRLGMFSILTDPIQPESSFISKLKRNLEKKVLKKLE